MRRLLLRVFRWKDYRKISIQQWTEIMRRMEIGTKKVN